MVLIILSVPFISGCFFLHLNSFVCISEEILHLAVIGYTALLLDPPAFDSQTNQENIWYT
jgi:hypothetical protein